MLHPLALNSHGIRSLHRFTIVGVDHLQLHIDVGITLGQLVAYLQYESTGLAFADTFCLGTVEQVYLVGLLQKSIEVVGINGVFVFKGGDVVFPL